jgi:hypothetical protein
MDFDVFLSHSGKDTSDTLLVARALAERNIRVWLDKWNLTPGRPWQEEIEDAIQHSLSAAVLIGADGIGPWEDREMRACIYEFVRRGMPVIPVLLPSAPFEPVLPLFLRGFTWVDFRGDAFVTALNRLEWGVRAPRVHTSPQRLPDTSRHELPIRASRTALPRAPSNTHVVFDSSHNEYLNIESNYDQLHRRSDFDFTYFRQHLLALGYRLTRLTGRARLYDPEVMGDVLVLGQPESFYPHSALLSTRIDDDIPEERRMGFLADDELQALVSFVAGGGGLLVCQEYNGEFYRNKKRNNLNHLAKTFGFTFNDDTVKLRDDHHITRAVAGHENLRISADRLVPHPLFAELESLLYLKGCSLREYPAKTSLTRTVTKSEIVCSSYDGRGLIAICEYGRGRVVLIGDVTGFSRSAMEPGANSYFENSTADATQQQRFVANLFQWLAKGDLGQP